jgi:hypothetical protein
LIQDSIKRLEEKVSECSNKHAGFDKELNDINIDKVGSGRNIVQGEIMQKVQETDKIIKVNDKEIDDLIKKIEKK